MLRLTCSLPLVLLFGLLVTACPEPAPVTGDSGTGPQHDAAAADAGSHDAGAVDAAGQDAVAPADASLPDTSTATDAASGDLATVADASADDATPAADAAIEDTAVAEDAQADSDAAAAADAAVDDASSATDAASPYDAGSVTVDPALLCAILMRSQPRMFLYVMASTGFMACDTVVDWDGTESSPTMAEAVAEVCVPGQEPYDSIAEAFDAGRFVITGELGPCMAAGQAYRQSHQTVGDVLTVLLQATPFLEGGECDGLLEGTLAADAQCKLDWECGPDLHCDYDGDNNDYRCQTPAVGGAACSTDNLTIRRCGPGLACVDLVCMVPQDEGGACTEDAACGDGLYCNRNVTNLCTAYVGEGGDCSAQGARCDSGLYCRSADQLCSAKLGSGEACAEADGSQACTPCLFCRRAYASAELACLPLAAGGEYCSGDNVCVSTSFCNSSQICQLRLGAGETCSYDRMCAAELHCDVDQCVLDTCLDRGDCEEGHGCTRTEDCDDGLACHPDTNVCTPLPAAGESCDVIPTCATGLYCDRGLCVAKLEAGARCSDNVECLSGLCGGRPSTCAPEHGGCMFNKSQFGQFVFFGLVAIPLRRRLMKR